MNNEIPFPSLQLKRKTTLASASVAEERTASMMKEWMWMAALSGGGVEVGSGVEVGKRLGK
jgi:hypothetical protein